MPSTLTVLNTNDSGAGSLRQAILDSNTSVGVADTIAFNIGGGGVQTISPLSQLPTITDAVTIDGTTQPGFAGSPIIELSGASAGNSVGLSVTVADCTIRGLVVNRFVFAGITISGSGASGNHIEGNYLGTNVSGTAALGNNFGVRISSPSNFVGGPTAAQRNLISGNRIDGVLISGGNNNVVAGNYIGTDVTGTLALGNSFQGVDVTQGASSNQIGTNGDGVADAAEGNLISGQGVTGVRISDLGTDHNLVAGNLIGTDKTGTVAVPNLGDGVFIGSGAQFTRIGTNADGVSDALERNVISAAAHNGIRIDAAQNNTIAGNYIGTNITGTAALGNGEGILVHDGASGNLIGTNGDGVNDAAERNLISGNQGLGINITGANSNVVAGNYIGTDASGTFAVGNANNGVFIFNGSSNRVGTNGDGVADAAEANVISGQGITGVSIGGLGTAPQDSHSNIVAGNLIGTDKTGTVAIPNQGDGIYLGFGSHDNRIGTNADGVSDALERNIISAAPHNGIRIDAAQNNTIAGNYIGTNVTGTAALGNFNGIELHDGASGNLIGTNGDGVRDDVERNIISGNVNGIVMVDSATTGNIVAGDYIGTNVTGAAALPNGFQGVFLASGAQENQIGGTPALANTIAFNGFNGVVVRDAGTVNNRIQANSIYGNGSLGIDLGNNGPTLNDPLDADNGPNQLQNFPVIISSTPGATTQISGRFNSKPNATYALDFYANAAADPSGFGEGQRYLGAATVTTDGAGNVRFTVVLPGSSAAGEIISATATDPDGNTSEFSGNRPPIANAGGPYVITEGQGVTLNASASSDPDFDTLTYSWDINGDGTFGDAVGVQPTLTAAQMDALGINDGPQTFQVRVKVDDDAGHVVTSPAVTLTVANALPIASIAGPADGVVGQTRTFTLSATDAGPVDQAAGFVYLINWGDGSQQQTVNRTAGNGSGVTVDHVFATVGTYNVSVTVTDKDSGVSQSASLTIDITNAHVDFSGRVFNDLNNDGLFNGSDAGLADVTVSLFAESNLSTPIATQTTDSNGLYTFTVVVPPGAYRLVETPPAGRLDGKETAGTLGGSVDNTQDSDIISAIVIPPANIAATGYNFADIAPAHLQGLVWQDFNDDDAVDFGEQAIQGVTIHLTGADDRGNSVSRTMTTDAQGIFDFTNLRPSDGNGYTVSEDQPTSFADGRDSLGTVNGVATGTVLNDAFSHVTLALPGADAVNYNFGERPLAGDQVHSGQTATIGFWQNGNGQSLLKSLNGGSGATQLGNWLAATFPHMYGANAGANNLAGMTNAQVVGFYSSLFKRTSSVDGPPKVDAQALAVAFAVYVTNEDLAGTTAAAYGFHVTANGVGAATFDVGSANRDAFGLSSTDSTTMTVMDILLATDARTHNGLLYDLDGSGTTSSYEVSRRVMANNVFTAINQQGDI
jgi:SdrD B-like domain/PKD domain/Periplasmic copper-binding protein (NosD)